MSDEMSRDRMAAQGLVGVRAGSGDSGPPFPPYPSIAHAKSQRRPDNVLTIARVENGFKMAEGGGTGRNYDVERVAGDVDTLSELVAAWGYAHFPTQNPETSVSPLTNTRPMTHEDAGVVYQTGNFGDALRALKMGRRVHRVGWNGRGMWLVLIRAGNAMRDGFPMQDCIGMKTADGKMQPGWLASQADMLSEDWLIHPG
jgi:hypothetical protein